MICDRKYVDSEGSSFPVSGFDVVQLKWGHVGDAEKHESGYRGLLPNVTGAQCSHS